MASHVPSLIIMDSVVFIKQTRSLISEVITVHHGMSYVFRFIFQLHVCIYIYIYIYYIIYTRLYIYICMFARMHIISYIYIYIYIYMYSLRYYILLCYVFFYTPCLPNFCLQNPDPAKKNLHGVCSFPPSYSDAHFPSSCL